MRDLKVQWTDLETKIEKIYVDAKHFGKEKPRFEYYELIMEELNSA